MKNIPGRNSAAQYEILFRASLPALGFNTYYFESNNMTMKTKSTIKVISNEACVLQNKVFSHHRHFSIYIIFDLR